MREKLDQLDKLERIRLEEIATQNLVKQSMKNLAKNWNIDLRKGSNTFILNAAETVSNGKNLTVEPINSTLKTEIMS